MSKYNALWEYIRENQPSVMTFEEIQGVLGFPIDHSFLTFKKELLEYGSKVEKISLKENTVRFAKLD